MQQTARRPPDATESETGGCNRERDRPMQQRARPADATDRMRRMQQIDQETDRRHKYRDVPMPSKKPADATKQVGAMHRASGVVGSRRARDDHRGRRSAQPTARRKGRITEQGESQGLRLGGKRTTRAQTMGRGCMIAAGLSSSTSSMPPISACEVATELWRRAVAVDGPCWNGPQWADQTVRPV